MRYYSSSLIWVLLLAISDRGYGQTEPSKPEKTNIVFIMVDDLNDWVHYLDEYSFSKTPNIDQLAEKGVSFRNAYANVAICNPSRVSILTGIHPEISRIRRNGQYPYREILPNAISLNQHLKMGGYKIAGYGKIYHKSDSDNEYWDEFESLNVRPKPFTLPGSGINDLASLDWGKVDKDENLWGDVEIATKAMQFLNEYSSEDPFFLAVGFRLPHEPWYTPETYWNDYDEEIDYRPEFYGSDLSDLNIDFLDDNAQTHSKIMDNSKWNEAAFAYSKSFEFIDNQIGRIISTLASKDFKSNTVVILTSDHGFMLGEKERWHKNVLWRDALRVPLIIYDPKLEEQGRSIFEPVSLIDIYPTIQSIAKLKYNPYLHGENLYNHILTDSFSGKGVFSVHQSGHESFITENYHLIKYSKSEAGELYNLKDDKDEWFNLYNDINYKDIVESLEDSILSYKNNLSEFGQTYDVTEIEFDEEIKRISWKKQESENVHFRIKVYINDQLSINDIVFDNFYDVSFNLFKDDRILVMIRVETPSTSGNWIEKDYSILTSTESEEEVQSTLEINNIYPNPFNSATIINYEISVAGIVKLDMFDINGRLVRNLVDEYKNFGSYTFRLNAGDLPSGIYYLRGRNENKMVFKKMSLIK
ncbi:MAG: hypothetical protein BalsKO_07420 [Balneolaceae bacterium]